MALNVKLRKLIIDYELLCMLAMFTFYVNNETHNKNLWKKKEKIVRPSFGRRECFIQCGYMDGDINDVQCVL